MMKKIFSDTKFSHLTLLIVVGFIAMIWLFDSLLSLSFNKKIYLCVIAILLWFLQFLLFPAKSATPHLSKEQNNKILKLKARFSGAIEFFKKTKIFNEGKHISLNQLPWFLLTGISQSGKSSLLANANIPYLLSKTKKNNDSDTCDWWATKNAVLVDIPGAFDKNIWQHFLELLKHHKKHSKVKGIIVAIPLAEFLMAPNKSKKKELILTMRQTLLQLQKSFTNKIPIYFVITKCDRIPGFTEFFSEALTDELSQTWGVNLPELKENESALNVFIQLFNQLLKKLNKQLIWRLHQERNSNLRPFIKDFPLHVERLKSIIGFFIKGLALPYLNLRGVYLTSSTQPSPDEGPTTIINGSQQVIKLLRNPTKSRPYFISRLLSQTLLANLKEGQPPPKNREKTIFAISSAAITLFVAGIVFFYDFQRGAANTHEIQNYLSQYKLVTAQSNNYNDNLVKVLPLLSTVQQAQNQEKQMLFNFYSKKSAQTANLIHQEILKTILLPNIKKIFENFLKMPNMQEGNQLYATLKAYLSLQQDRRNEIDFIVEQLKPLLIPSLDEKTKSEILYHVRQALKLTTTVEIDPKILEQSRLYLQSLPSHELAWIILQNKYSKNFLKLDDRINDSVILFSKLNSSKIPYIYTANAFETCITRDIQASATEALYGNNLLGSFANASMNVKDLSDQLQTQYIAEYASVWESLLNDLRLTKVDSLTQLDNLISKIVGNNSPLLNFLKIANRNTAFNLIIEKSNKLNALDKMFGTAQTQSESVFYRTFVSLGQLHQYLTTILTGDDIGKNAFFASAQRMQQTSNDPITELYITASQASDPIKSWLTLIAQKSWGLLLQETANYIETQWQLNILTQYHSYRSLAEIDLQQFSNLTAKQGILYNFQETYLKPFINSFAPKWQWKVIDNQALPFSQLALDEIQNASKLQNISKFILFSKGRTLASVQNFKLPEKLSEEADFG